MNNSIHLFAEEGVKRLTKVFESYTEDLTKIAEMVQGVMDPRDSPRGPNFNYSFFCSQGNQAHLL